MTIIAAEPFRAPTVESLSVRIVVDSFFDQFMPKQTHPLAHIEHVSRIRGRETTTLAGEWGLSLHLESRGSAAAGAGASGQYLLDFGYTPEILLRNFDLLDLAADKLDGLILSHAHRDHYGGMVGFVARHRAWMRDDLRLFTGGGDLTFREKWLGAGRAEAGEREEPRSWGALDKAALEAAHVETVACQEPHMLQGPFTSGQIARQSFERVLPNTLVEPTAEDHYSEEERRGRLVPDRHPDEHATCYIVQGRGLVVISSCGHCGLINTIRTAMAAANIGKLHAVIGGFHLGVAPPDYVEHTIAELKALDPDIVLPMHCSGRAFIAGVAREMPERLIYANTGSRFTFGA